MYNRSEIMKAAWYKYRHFDITFAQALRLAWVDARQAAARYNVYGERFGMTDPELIESGVDAERVAYLKDLHEYRYDRVWTVKAA